jgi:V8-like Glu-specific endopeptidase
MKPTHLDRLTRTLAREPSRRQVVRGFCAAIVAGMTSGRRSGGEALAAICGGIDTSQDVELYNGSLGVTRELVAAREAPVGQLRWDADLLERYADAGNVNGRRWCSGTLVADDLFLTAGYCLANRPVGWSVPKIEGTDQPISRDEVATNMNVIFGYQLDPNGSDQPGRSFPVVALVEDRLEDLDYAILKLDDAPGTIFGRARIAAQDPPLGSTIFVIGHPEGQEKRIDAGHVSDLQDGRIYYSDIATRGGSGGSGIFSSPEGTLVGMHTNGGCDDPKIGSNYGVAVSGLLQVSPVLSELAGD